MKQCDFCSDVARYDGKTRSGPWANMCEYHMTLHGYPGNDGLTRLLRQARPATTTASEISFEEWLAAVNRKVEALCGLSLDDLPDTNTRDAWEDGVEPSDFAEQAMQEAW